MNVDEINNYRHHLTDISNGLKKIIYTLDMAYPKALELYEQLALLDLAINDLCKYRNKDDV